MDPFQQTHAKVWQPGAATGFHPGGGARFLGTKNYENRNKSSTRNLHNRNVNLKKLDAFPHFTDNEGMYPHFTHNEGIYFHFTHNEGTYPHFSPIQRFKVSTVYLNCLRLLQNLPRNFLPHTSPLLFSTNCTFKNDI